MKIKEKIKNWLLEDEIKQFKSAIDKYEMATNKLITAQNVYRNAEKECIESGSQLREAHRVINSIVDVGTDIGYRSDDHSWAVICVKGKPEYVKFMPLTHRDTVSVMQFLKNFKYSNRQTDSPLAYQFMEDWIMK